jgi:hypothetical protein
MGLQPTHRSDQKTTGSTRTDLFEFDVFISYTLEDIDTAQLVSQVLSSCGLRVFLSDATLKKKLGESWFEIIQSALEGSRHFLLLASQASMASPWVQREYKAFYNHCYKSGSRRLIPLAMGTYKNSQLPLFLKDLEAGHLHDDDCLTKIIRLFGGADLEQLKQRLSTTQEENRGLKQKVVFVEAQLAAAERIRLEMHDREDVIEGKRLFQHAGYYPIKLAPETDIPSLNRAIFIKAINYFLKDKHNDKLAAMDLVYLREDNLRYGDADILLERDLKLYEKLIRKYQLTSFIADLPSEHNRLFRNFIRLVDEIGDTLEGIQLEVVLHNVRNPVHSIIAARNTNGISNRKVGDPSTRFVADYVRNQGRSLMHCNGRVAYLKQFNGSKYVKATTTPLYDQKYGLIAILCINIDIDAVQAIKGQPQEFFEMYVRNSGTTPGFEQDSCAC